MSQRTSLVFWTLTFAAVGHASLVSTVSINPFGPCGNPQTVTGTTSASLTVCSSPEGGNGFTTINFGITSTTVASYSLFDGAGAHTNTHSSSSFDDVFVITGGSGTGFFNLSYVQSNQSGDNDPQASTSYSVLASLNGVQYSDQVICSNLPAQEGITCPHTPDPIGFIFTYGVPFELSVAVTGVAGGGLAGFVPVTYMGASGVLDYTLPNPTDVLSISQSTPEPASGLLFLMGGVVWGMKWRRRARHVN